MNDTANTGRPWHLWLVGLLSLAWNAFGGYDYVMTRQHSLDYLTPLFGDGVDAFIAYIDGFPLWVDVCWALGVWASVAGAILLLARSGFAFYAFVLSLAGMVATQPYYLGNPLPGVTDTSGTYGMTGAIVALLLFEIVYSRKMAAKGVLR